MSKSPILHQWVMDLPEPYQTCLLSAIRGCDLPLAYSEMLVYLVKHYRKTVLNLYPCKFIAEGPGPDPAACMAQVLKIHELLPLHYWMHLVQAAEVVGYHHPDSSTKSLWLGFYERACQKLHLPPESFNQLKARMDGA